MTRKAIIASKDLLITRQVAVKAAVDLVTSEIWGGGKVDLEEVLDISLKISSWILRDCWLSPDTCIVPSDASTGREA